MIRCNQVSFIDARAEGILCKLYGSSARTVHGLDRTGGVLWPGVLHVGHDLIAA